MTRKYFVNNKYYRIIITEHALKRVADRQIPANHIINTIIDMIAQHTNMGKYIMLKNMAHNFSLVINIHNNNIKIITALNKTTCYTKKDTQVITI